MDFRKLRDTLKFKSGQLILKVLDFKDKLKNKIAQRVSSRSQELTQPDDISTTRKKFDFEKLLHWFENKTQAVRDSEWAKNASKISTDDILRHQATWKLGLVIASGFACGHLLTALLGNIMMNNRAASPPSFVQPSSPAPPAKQMNAYSDIYEKPIFDHEGFVPQFGGPGSDKLDCSAATPSTLPLELIGTIVLEKEELSVASIRDKSQNKVEAYQKNEVIGNHPVTIQKIEFQHVCLLNQSGKLEFIEVREMGGGIKISTGAAKGPVGVGITQEDENNYAINAKWKDEQIANIGEIVTQARAIPHFENGQIIGFRIINIKRGGVFDQLGIKEGDIVEEVNDIPLSNQGQALGLFNQLKDMGEGSITIVLNRNGTQLVKNYNLRQ